MVSESAQVVITTVFTVLVITDILGNSLVCAVIIKSQEMRLVENRYVNSKDRKKKTLDHRFLLGSVWKHCRSGLLTSYRLYSVIFYCSKNTNTFCKLEAEKIVRLLNTFGFIHYYSPKATTKSKDYSYRSGR